MERRTRTFTWQDPAASVEAASTMSGIELIRAMFAGQIPPPPITATMDFRGVEVGEGTAAFEAEPGEFLYNPIGTVHGGFAMTLLDSAMGCAVHTTLAAGERYTTLEVSVNFVRPITTETGRVRCEGKVLHRGGRVATAEGRLFVEGTGKLLAHASTTCLVTR
jgi:uncharacterized protein (TIGR00369 family)